MRKNKRHIIDRPSILEGDEVSTVYGDIVTFIMMLFILLFILSYNKNKEADFFIKMQQKISGKAQKENQTLSTDHLLVSQLQNFIKTQDLEKHTQVLVDEQKIKLILNAPTFFSSGSAILSSRGQRAITGLTQLLKGVDNPIMIEGHTDNIPIKSSQYDSNWELSFHRAYSVLKILINRLNHTPDTLSATGYGEYRPIASNDTSEGRARNRRIEVNIIRLTKTTTK